MAAAHQSAGARPRAAVVAQVCLSVPHYVGSNFIGADGDTGGLHAWPEPFGWFWSGRFLARLQWKDRSTRTGPAAATMRRRCVSPMRAELRTA